MLYEHRDACVFSNVFLSGYMPRCVIARSYGNSIFKYLRNFHTISIVGVPVYIPTNSAEVFPLLQQFVICRHFNDGHSDWCEVTALISNV